MNATVTTSPWLGERRDQWHPEIFPEGMLTEQQVRTILNIEDKGRFIQNLNTAGRAIYKLTDEITEVHCRFGTRMFDLQLVLWFNTDGKMLATVEEHYEGPMGVHKPGDKFRKWYTAYWRTPKMRTYDHAIEFSFDEMYGLGRDGAAEATRQFIRENWITDNSDDKE